MNRLYSIVVFFFLFALKSVQAQQLIEYNVPFGTSSPQSMWGPNGINVGINNTWQLMPPFDTGWQSTGWVPPTIPVNTPFGSGEIGASMLMKVRFSAGLEFALENFTLGQVNVDYPIDVDVVTPSHLTYDQGDQVLVETSYEVADGWALDTYYPNPGNARLTLNIGVGAALALKFCFFSCSNVDIIPEFYEVLPIDIFNLDFNMNDGDGMDATFLDIPGLGPVIEEDIPDTLFTSMITNDPLGEWGLSAWITPPYVVTSDNLVQPEELDIEACGESQYVHTELNILDLLSHIPYLTFLAYFDDSYTYSVPCPTGGNIDFTIWWNLFTMTLEADIYNKQCFDFKPKVWGSYEFPVPIEYEVLDGATGAVVESGTNSIIECEVGNDINMKYPCYFQDLEVTPTYSIDGQFTSHTYDSIPLNFCYSGLAAGVTWNDCEIIPAITLCVPCPTSWTGCGLWDCCPCWGTCCVTTPSLSLYDLLSPSDLPFGGILGPYIPPECIPLASVTYDWVPEETWPLDGFDEYTMPPFNMQASPLGVSNIHTDVDCFGGNNGSIDVSFTALSPALPYTFEWTNGAISEDLTNLTAGPYELSAYDANGCQLFTGATILEPESPVSIMSTPTGVSCNGGVSDGTISLLVQGGTPPYTYLWNNGATTQNVNGLASGTYTVTVTDSKGCQEMDTVDVTEPSALGQVGAVTHVLCNGTNTGAISVDVFGGTLPYTYSWDSGQTSLDIENVLSGNYTLTATDVNDCVSTNTYAVDEPALPIQLAVTGVDILCATDSSGSIDLTANGGTPGYTFEWSNQAGIVLPYQSEDISNIPADVYTVLVTDLNNCTDEISIELTEPAAALTTAPVLTHINCFGDATGAIDPMVSGGTAVYTFNWNNGSTASSISGLAAGVYNLNVTDNNGCTYFETYTLTEPTQLVLSSSTTDVLCFGDATGTAEVLATGATPNYSYNWSSGQNTAFVENLSAGSYSVTVTDNFGCSEVANVVINEPAAPLSVSYNVTAVDCYGNATGAVDMTPAGGTTPYSYIWATSGSIVLATTLEDITDLVADTYLLTITDSNGCVLNSSVNVPEPTEPLDISGTTVDVLCYSGNNGSIDINVTGGTQNYSYAWSNGATSEDINTLIFGSYSVVVTDANGCQIDDTYEIDQPDNPLVASVETNDVLCLGGNDGYMTSNVSGGTGPYTYLWSNGDASENAYNLVAGAYSLTVTDANGCTAFTGGVINEPTTYVDLNYTVTDVLCFGGSDGQIEISAFGGTEPYYFNWGNQNDILMSEEGEILDGLNIGDYLIRVIDANGCIHEEVVTVSEPTLLETSNTSTDVLCYGDSTGVIDATNWGGTPPYTILWSDGQVTEDAVGLGAGWYDYIVTDDHGCIVRDTGLISQPSQLYLNSGQITNVTCVDQSDGSIYVSVEGGTPPYYFLWSNGSEDDYVTDLDAGWYSLIYWDEHGCMDSVFYFVESSTSDCLSIPNTITPNGDMYNDTWIIENIHLYPGAEVLVFNKWGNKLYESVGEYTPWDGTINGSPLPSEVYYYIIVLNNDNGDKYTGTITIVR